MTVKSVIPILRIFDYQKAIEFYVDWLGFSVDWEHRFEENTPIYMQVSKDGIVMHLTEHHGDCSPGARIYIDCTELKEYHRLLLEKQYKYNRPGLEDSFYGTWCMEVTDPFANRITFNEDNAQAK